MTGDAFTLGTEFSPQNLDAWQKVAEATLKGKPLGKLTTTTYDGLEVKPLYIRSTEPSPNPGLPGFAPYTRGRTPHAAGWRIAHIYRADQVDRWARTIEQDLKRGVETAVLEFSATPEAALPNADALAKGLTAMDPSTPISLRPGPDFVPAAALLAAAWKLRGWKADQVKGAFGADPLGHQARESALADLADLVLVTHQTYPQVRAVRIDPAGFEGPQIRRHSQIRRR